MSPGIPNIDGTLKKGRYDRDIGRGLDIPSPRHYYPDGNPARDQW